MQVTSLTFYFWVAGSVGIYYRLPGRWRIPFFLLLSGLFYAVLNPLSVPLLAAETIGVFLVGQALRRNDAERTRTLLFWCGLTAVLGSLVFYKAAGALSGWILPLGISYYTFKLISYLLEVYWDPSQAVESLPDFSVYVAFGPQMVSGPIQRPHDFWPQLEAVRERTIDPALITEGMQLILSGLLLKMLIGDRLGDFVSLVDLNPQSYSRSVVIASTLSYAVQLYADFAGYTNIALGLGLLFGIRGPANFNAPFAAVNIQQYWRRWHMSLTSWLTDYVFMPLRMSTRTLGTAGLALSIMINFVLVGLWHGFAYTFLIFGLIHGVFMIVSALTLSSRDKVFAGMPPVVHRLRAFVGIIFTYVLVSFSQIWFRAPSADAALIRFKQIMGLVPSGVLSIADIRSDISVPLYICLPLAYYLGAGAPGIKMAWSPVSRFVPEWALYGAGMLMLSLLTSESGSKFIYGQF